MSNPVTNFPLCWPSGWKRAKAGSRINGRFNKKEQHRSTVTPGSYYRRTEPVSIADAVKRVLEQLSRFGASYEKTIISTDIEPRLDGLPRSGKEPDDPGVAVYWSTSANPTQKCMAIDRYLSTADNLAAVAATLEAMRAIERHGGAEILERAFLGFQSLPPPMRPRPWWEVLEFENGMVTRGVIEQRYDVLAHRYHPDHGGSHDKMAELNEAIRQAREALA